MMKLSSGHTNRIGTVGREDVDEPSFVFSDPDEELFEYIFSLFC